MATQSASPLPESRSRPSLHAYGNFLRSMLKVGVLGFGGGSALIPVMEKELVQAGQLSDSDFLKATVIANITPGALPAKLAAVAGATTLSAWGALGGAIAVSLPGAVGTFLILGLFSALGPEAMSMLETASLGISAFILSLLAHYVVKVLRTSRGWDCRRSLIAFIGFIMTGANRLLALICELADIKTIEVPELSAMQLVTLALATIGIWTLIQTSGRAAHATASNSDIQSSSPARFKRAIASVVAMLALVGVGFAVSVVVLPGSSTLALMGLLALSTLASFGGGEAYVGVADGFFVSTGLVDRTVFYGQLVPVANALPGPILVKIACAIGYAVGASSGATCGLGLGIAALLVTVGTCSAVALLVLAMYDRAKNSRFVQNVDTFILPVICGLLASTAVSLLHSSAQIAARFEWSGLSTVIAILAAAGAVWLLKSWRQIPDAFLVVALATTSVLIKAVG